MQENATFCCESLMPSLYIYVKRIGYTSEALCDAAITAWHYNSIVQSALLCQCLWKIQWLFSAVCQSQFKSGDCIDAFYAMPNSLLFGLNKYVSTIHNSRLFILPSTHCHWVDRGIMEWENCPTHLQWKMNQFNLGSTALTTWSHSLSKVNDNKVTLCRYLFSFESAVH